MAQGDGEPEPTRLYIHRSMEQVIALSGWLFYRKRTRIHN